jgi:hypothetical protein
MTDYRQLVDMLEAEGCRRVGTFCPDADGGRGQALDVWEKDGKSILVASSQAGIDLLIRLDRRLPDDAIVRLSEFLLTEIGRDR